MKFGLLTVTYSGLFYAGPALSVEQQILKARALGFDALAIETKRPVAFPLDLDAAARARYQQMAERLAIGMSGGSDYHADHSHHASGLGAVTLPAEAFADLEARAGRPSGIP